MLLSYLHVLLPSSLSTQGWGKLSFCVLSILGTLFTIFNIDVVYLSFSLLFKEGESSLFMFFGKGESELYILNTIPVIIYLDVISDRNKILNENRGKSGIYRWTNVNN